MPHEHVGNPAPASAAESIGLVGLGLMGSAFAARMRQAGFGVVGFDVAPDRLADAARAGVIPAGGTVEVARNCRRILLSLPDHRASGAVLAGLEDVLQPGQVIVDTTTGEPEAAARLGARLAARGVEYLDATVSGSSEQVRRAETTIMAGGTEAGFAACADLLALFAGRVLHVGPWGHGARLKLVTNLVLGLNRAALAEGLAFARALGVAPATALDVLRAGMAASRIMDTKGPKMVRGDFTPQARLAQHLKDVRLMLEQAARAGLALPLSEAHARLLEAAVAAGLGELDNSAVLKVLEGGRNAPPGG